MQVLAGPGSGKTFTIIRRICYLLDQCSIRPETILVITFTREAANEMKRRFMRSYTYPFPEVQFGTFHSIFYQILKESDRIGQVNPATEQEKRNILQRLIPDQEKENWPEEDTITILLSEISKVKNSAKGLTAFTESKVLESREQFEQLYKEYNEVLKMQGKIDFDDMILRCFTLLKENPAIRQKWQEQFQFILVDEFQDINGLQYQVLKLLAQPHNNIFVVGDDDQAIYGFRGAQPAIMKEFLQDFPDCRQIFLTVNYRSHCIITESSSKIIAENRDRIGKQIVSASQCDNKDKETVMIRQFAESEAETEYLVSLLKSKTKVQLADTAIIMRTNQSVQVLSIRLAKEGIPYHSRLKQSNPFQHFIARDFISYLTFSGDHNRKDFLRIMNRPLRYITRSAVTEPVVTEQQVLSYYQQNTKMQSEIQKLFANCRLLATLSPFLAINYIRKGMGYDIFLKTINQNCPAKDNIAMADSLQESARGYETFAQWHSFTKDYQPLSDKDSVRVAGGSQAEGVSLLTMHAAKGLEYSCVIIPDITQGNIPSRKAKRDAEMEEERRLLYVAMTRAKEELHLLSSSSSQKQPSVFLKPLISP